MQHVDSYRCLDFEICLVPHKQLDKSYITVEAGEVQRVEPLFRFRGRVDPSRNSCTYLILEVDDYLGIKQLRIVFTLPRALRLLQILHKTLLVVDDQVLSALERIVVGRPMQ